MAGDARNAAALPDARAVDLGRALRQRGYQVPQQLTLGWYLRWYASAGQWMYVWYGRMDADVGQGLELPSAHLAVAVVKLQSLLCTMRRSAMLDCEWHLGQVFMAAERLYAFKGLSGKLGPIGVHVSLLAIMAGVPLTLPATGPACASLDV